MLRHLAQITADDAVLIGDTVDPSVGLEPDSDFDRHQQAQVAAGKYMGQIGLRLSYGSARSPWWQQCNIRQADAVDFIADTGWMIQDQTMDGMDHYLALTKAQ